MSGFALAVSICVFLLENHSQDPTLAGWSSRPAERIAPLSTRQDTVRFAHEDGVWAVEMSYEDVLKQERVIVDGVYVNEGWRCEASHSSGAADARAELAAADEEFTAAEANGIFRDVTGRVTLKDDLPEFHEPRIKLFCGTSGWMEAVVYGERADRPGDVFAIVQNDISAIFAPVADKDLCA